MHTSWVRCGVTLFLPVCLTLSGCEFGWMAPTATTHCSTTAELSDGDAVEIESRHGSVHVTMDPSLSQVEIDGRHPLRRYRFGTRKGAGRMAEYRRR